MRRRSSRGSVLLLIPAGFAIVLLLTAIAVDSAVMHLRQRELVELASAAANDAVSAGIDLDRYRTDGTAVLDADRVRAILAGSIAAGGTRAAIGAVEIGSDSVRLTLVSSSAPIFGRAFGRAPTPLEATVTVTAHESTD